VQHDPKFGVLVTVGVGVSVGVAVGVGVAVVNAQHTYSDESGSLVYMKFLSGNGGTTVFRYVRQAVMPV